MISVIGRWGGGVQGMVGWWFLFKCFKEQFMTLPVNECVRGLTECQEKRQQRLSWLVQIFARNEVNKVHNYPASTRSESPFQQH